MRRWHRRGAMVTVVVAALTVAAGRAAGAQTDAGGGTDGSATREPRVITVHATGLVSGTPDVFEVALGVDTRAKSAADALAENSKLTIGVLAVLSDAGVADKDVQTSRLSISPVYDDDGEVVIAFEVNNQVVAELHDLTKAGHVIDAATKVAGDQIVVQGLYFSIDDNSDLVARARADAVKRAKGQAQQLADAAGVELGALRSIVEERAPVGPVLEAEKTDAPSPAASGDAVPPIQPGAETLSVDVTLVYTIT
jgi:uncharacterized protein